MDLEKLSEDINELKKLKELNLSEWILEGEEPNKYELRQLLIQKVIDGEFDKFILKKEHYDNSSGFTQVEYIVKCKSK